MKVAYCLTDSSRAGGMERSICCKANYLADVVGYDVTIITTDGENREMFYDFSPNVNFINLKIGYEELYELPFFRKLKLQIKKRKVHRERLAQILLQLRPDIAISTYSHELSFLCKIKDGSKKIIEYHFSKSLIRAQYSRMFKFSPERIFALLAERRKRWFIRKYESFVVLTKEEKQAWKEYGNVTIIPNVLPFYPGRYSNSGARRIISVGRLSVEKGFSYLIEAWSIVHRKHPEWVLNIYGDGDEYAVLREQILSLKLLNVVNLRPSSKDIEEEYISSSMFVMSSLSEGFGIVLAEAMACGLPCVSFNTPYGPAEIITHGEDGILVEYKNVNKLAEAIIFLIEDEALRKEMGGNARINIKRFQSERIMPRWISLFEQVTGTSGY